MTAEEQVQECCHEGEEHMLDAGGVEQQQEQYHSYHHHQQQATTEETEENHHHHQYEKSTTTTTTMPTAVTASSHQHGAGTVFVGGISYKVDEEQLKTCFSKYGEIVDIKIIRDKFNFNQSKGYGFVTFEDPAVAELVKSEEYIEFMGKTMNVGDAYRGGTRPAPYYHNPSSPIPHHQLLLLGKNGNHVGGIPKNVYYPHPHPHQQAILRGTNGAGGYQLGGSPQPSHTSQATSHQQYYTVNYPYQTQQLPQAYMYNPYLAYPYGTSSPPLGMEATPVNAAASPYYPQQYGYPPHHNYSMLNGGSYGAQWPLYSDYNNVTSDQTTTTTANQE